MVYSKLLFGNVDLIFFTIMTVKIRTSNCRRRCPESRGGRRVRCIPSGAGKGFAIGADGAVEQNLQRPTAGGVADEMNALLRHVRQQPNSQGTGRFGHVGRIGQETGFRVKPGMTRTNTDKHRRSGQDGRCGRVDNLSLSSKTRLRRDKEITLK